MNWVPRPRLGFTSLAASQQTLVGSELRHMIKKQQRVVEAGNAGLTAAEPCSALASSFPHRNQMCYRLLRGDTLMRRVLDDAARGVSLLRAHHAVDSQRIGTLGHSYGGNTVLFHAALDVRLGFACASGAACSYANKMRHGTGIEMAEIIPGFTQHFDVQDLVKCIAPRKTL